MNNFCPCRSQSDHAVPPLSRTGNRASAGRNAAFTIVICLSAVFLFRCGNDKDVFLSIDGRKSTVVGEVYPIRPGTRVFLLENNDTLSISDMNQRTGAYSFFDVPYGQYNVVAVQGKWAGSQEAAVNESFEFINDICLVYNGEYLRESFLTEDDTLTVRNRYQNTIQMKFVLNPGVSFADDPFSLSPPILGRGSRYFIWENINSIEININADSFFTQTYGSITIRILAPQSSGSITQDSLSFDFHIDSTGLDSALTSDLVANVIFNNSFSSLRSTKTAFAIEGEIIVLFAHKMDNESVERSIMTAPSFSPNFFWQDNMLTIVPANSLVPQTNYTLTIGSGAQTSDSVKFRVPYAINFTTGSTDYFREYWPLDKEIGVARNVPFRFSFNYSVEPALLNAAFSITPLVDSLSFSTKKAGEILIGHAELLPDTTYKIVIDGSLSSSKGTVLGKDLQISFRTSGTLK